MKKFFYFLCMVICCVSCKTSNPPSFESTEAIIKLCYDGMGKPGEQLVEELNKLGINIKEVEMDSISQSKGYQAFRIVKEDEYEIHFISINGSVYYLNYKIHFIDEYPSGVNAFLELSDLVYNFGWEKWSGHNEHDRAEHGDRERYINDAKEIASTTKDASLTIAEFMIKPFNNEILHGQLYYSANSVGGENLITGHGISKKAYTNFYIHFELNEKNMYESRFDLL